MILLLSKRREHRVKETEVSLGPFIARVDAPIIRGGPRCSVPFLERSFQHRLATPPLVSLEVVATGTKPNRLREWCQSTALVSRWVRVCHSAGCGAAFPNL